MNWDKIAFTKYQQKSRAAAVSIKRFTGLTARWRTLCLQRDQYKCVLCRSTGNLEVHHIVRWVDAPLLRLKKNNGVTLCRQCHQLYHQSTGSEFPAHVTKHLLNYIEGNASHQLKSKASIILIKKHLGITPPRT